MIAPAGIRKDRRPLSAGVPDRRWKRASAEARFEKAPSWTRHPPDAAITGAGAAAGGGLVTAAMTRGFALGKGDKVSFREAWHAQGIAGGHLEVERDAGVCLL